MIGFRAVVATGVRGKTLATVDTSRAATVPAYIDSARDVTGDNAALPVAPVYAHLYGHNAPLT